MAGISTKFRAFTKGQLNIATTQMIRSAMQTEAKYADALVDYLRIYPSVMPGQKYKRTGILGLSWRVVGPNVTPDQIVAYIVNDAQDRRGKYYAIYVQGAWQTPIHEGRWSKIGRGEDIEYGVVDPIIATLRRGFRRELQRDFNRAVKYK